MNIKCDDCDGRGHDGEFVWQGHFQPPEPDACGSCGGSGSTASVFNVDVAQVREALGHCEPEDAAAFERIAHDVKVLTEVAREFCRRVEAGEVRSVRTYQRFVTALGPFK